MRCRGRRAVAGLAAGEAALPLAHRRDIDAPARTSLAVLRGGGGGVPLGGGGGVPLGGGGGVPLGGGAAADTRLLLWRSPRVGEARL